MEDLQAHSKAAKALLHDSDFLSTCQEFLELHHKREIEAIYFAEEDTFNYAIVIEYAELLDFKSWVAECLYFQPSKYLLLLNDAVRMTQADIKKIYEERKGDKDPEIPIKENIHVRLNIHGSAAECPETHPNISRIRVKDIGRLITLKGTVIRSGAIKLLEGERIYECSKCKYRFKVHPELETGTSIQKPTICPSQRTKACTGMHFLYVEGTIVCHDYQEIKIQENMQLLGVGSVPRSITVILKDDLVDVIKAGDDVVVTGVLFAKWRPLVKDVRCDLELMILANYIRKSNEFRLVEDISEQVLEQFQQFWDNYKHTPFKGEWMLEAGALVLADGGLCCIDEFDSIREPDRATIHEAMEQQTISVAKAGLVTTLNTRTTVFGVTNPKGTYDPYQPLCVNTTLSGPLLSRFDIVLVLLDTKNLEWDKIVSSHILSEHGKQGSCNSVNGSRGFWNLAMLKSYIQYVKKHFQPILTDEAESVIVSYYQLQRRSATQNAARTTVRMLESMIRLAQAHARLMFRNTVTKADAIAAIVCVESSMTTSAILDNVGNALHSSFAENPDEEYGKQEKLILEKLNLLMGNDMLSNQSAGLPARERGSSHSLDSRMASPTTEVRERGSCEVSAACQSKSSLQPCSNRMESRSLRRESMQQPRLSSTFTEEGLLYTSEHVQVDPPVTVEGINKHQ